jgi:hypothetical protein
VTSLPSLSASRTVDHSDVGREALADASVPWQWANLHAQLDEQSGAITRLERHGAAESFEEGEGLQAWRVFAGLAAQPSLPKVGWINHPREPLMGSHAI